MKKHHFIKMSSIALSLCVALGMVVTAAMQMTNTSILTAFIFPNPLKGV